jgi:organic radical activating enzyme
MNYNLNLEENEHQTLHNLLEAEINKITKLGGDPYYIADLVNVIRKIRHNFDVLLNQKKTVNAVVVTNPLDNMVKEPLKEAEMPKTKAKAAQNVTMVTETRVTPDNIDDMTDALLENDSDDEELNIESVKSKK